MRSVLSRSLHESGKNFYDSGYKRVDPSKWPKEWKTTYYKEYLRFPELPLQKSREETSLQSLIANRASERNLIEKGITFYELSILLQYSCGEFMHTEMHGKKIRRAQPSAGARYPIETYIILRKSADAQIEPGVYHYNVKKMSLNFYGKKVRIIFPNLPLIHG